jgi:hypothetical protein
VRRQDFLGAVVWGLLLASAFAWFVPRANAQAPVENREETGMQLDFHVPNAALKAFLPRGWTLNVAARGPARDANLRVIFMDRMAITGPNGRPVGTTGSSRLVSLVAPVKDPNGSPVQLVIGGLTDDPADAPGPLGVYSLATTHNMRLSYSTADGPVLASQDWVFASASGEGLEMHIQYERGVGFMTKPSEVKYCSAKNPTTCEISRQEMVLKILRNMTTNPPDQVKSFSFKASGGAYGKLFDGTQRVLSWDNIVWINRSIAEP